MATNRNLPLKIARWQIKLRRILFVFMLMIYIPTLRTLLGAFDCFEGPHPLVHCGAGNNLTEFIAGVADNGEVSVKGASVDCWPLQDLVRDLYFSCPKKLNDPDATEFLGGCRTTAGRFCRATTSLLRSDPDILCGSAEHRGITFLAFLVFCIYAIGFPFGV